MKNRHKESIRSRLLIPKTLTRQKRSTAITSKITMMLLILSVKQFVPGMKNLRLKKETLCNQAWKRVKVIYQAYQNLTQKTTPKSRLKSLTSLSSTTKGKK